MTKLMACFLLFVAGAVPGADAQTTAKGSAQPWPTRPVRMIVGFSAGSATDISARLLALAVVTPKRSP